METVSKPHNAHQAHSNGIKNLKTGNRSESGDKDFIFETIIKIKETCLTLYCFWLLLCLLDGFNGLNV